MTDTPQPSDAPKAAPDRALRRAAEWRDFGVLRHLWRNEAEIAPGVWRANHPGRARLGGYAARGIRTVLSLRGEPHAPPQLVEAADCAELGIELHILAFSARNAPKQAKMLALFEHFDRLPRPFLMHCKSGADRAGLAAALYLLDQRGADLATARRQLSWRFLHIARSKTGILDHVLDRYAPFAPMPVRRWVAEHYDAAATTASYHVQARR